MTLNELIDKYEDWHEHTDEPIERDVVEEVLHDLRRLSHEV